MAKSWTMRLNGDLQPSYAGDLNGPKWNSFGFAPRRETMAGLPHFPEAAFRGEFPLAALRFLGGHFPAEILLKAFNPFIPLNDKDLGIPAAFFEFEITNITPEAMDYTLAGTLGNPLTGNNLHTLEQHDGVTALVLGTDAYASEDVQYGNLTLATDAQDTSFQQYWFRGMWFDSLEVYWHDLTTPGKFENRTFPATSAGDKNQATLAAHFHLAPNELKTVRFVISWSFPNCENYWNPGAPQAAQQAGVAPTWKNYYTTWWPNSQDSAWYALQNWSRLQQETELFKNALFASTLPVEALDAVSATLSVLKSPTVLRLQDGTFYGWEGCHVAEGSCEGSCTHVWNYAQALPFLFPNLERSMREADYKYNLRPDGGMPFRIQLPLGVAMSNFRPCADGQFGGVMKTYRDWKISGDTGWLRRIWPAVKKSIEFAWNPHNEDRWDPEKTGVLWGRQHHTLDMELFGPNSWLTGFYLGALKAGAEMAEYLEETDTALEYCALFEKGKAWADKNLFNGEYYYQSIDLTDKSLIENFAMGSASITGGVLDAYWDAEHGEIKYQIGEGSEIDQVLAQWHANTYGLGEIFDPAQTRHALESIFRYNFKVSMREEYNPCRLYCLNDEGGLVICAWPHDAVKAVIPLPYSQETQNGYEYAAAIQMIQTGLVEEGMIAVKAIRDRYDGHKRNPWNEFEAGSNYARSMATYGLLQAFSGFEFNMVTGMIGFNPIAFEHDEFRCFWSLASGWGEVEVKPGQVEIRVLKGSLDLQTVKLPLTADKQVFAVTLGSVALGFAQDGRTVQIATAARIGAGSSLYINWNG